MRASSLRKCIRPVIGDTSPALMMIRRVPVLIRSSVNNDPHLPVILTVAYFLSHYRFRFQLITEFVFSIGLATLSYQFVEKPFLRLKQRFERARA